MKVLHILMSNRFSGAENVVCQIIETCDEYEMAYCSPKGEIEEELKKRGIKYISLEKKNIKSIKKAIKEYDPDIIHAHDYRASVLASSVKFKGKVISHLHNNNPSIKRWGLKSLIYNSTICKYDKVVMVSNAIYEEAVFSKKLAEKYYVLTNYLNKNEVEKKAEEENLVESDVIFVGRLEKPKNPLAFIDIISKIKEKKSDIKAVMVGDGSLKEECIKDIEKLDLGDNIQMMGFEENPYKIMKDSKVVLMPSKWDGLPMAAIESMILNKVVVARRVGGLKEIFKNNEELLFDENNEAVDIIVDLLKDDSKYLFQQNNIKKIVHKYIDKDRWTRELTEIYKGD